MRAAQAESSDDCEVKMKLVAPPLYVLTTYTLDKAKVGGPPEVWLSVVD
jgi:translation initiation factor 2 subunit 1